MKIVLFIFGSFIGSYVVFGILFYFFLSSLLKDDTSGKTVINPNSWHLKIAYPFRRLDNTYLKYMNPGFFQYFSKIYFMIIIGWPIIIFWEIAKFIIYTPFMFLFGAYPIPSLKAMSDSEMPLAVKIKNFYLPMINNGKMPLFPIYPATIAGYGLLVFTWPWWILVTTTLIITAVGLIVGSIFVYDIWFRDDIRIKKTRAWIGSRTYELIDFVDKYNHDIIVKDR